MIVLTEKMEVLVHCGVHGRVAVQLAEIAEENNVELCVAEQRSLSGSRVNRRKLRCRRSKSCSWENRRFDGACKLN